MTAVHPAEVALRNDIETAAVALEAVARHVAALNLGDLFQGVDEIGDEVGVPEWTFEEDEIDRPFWWERCGGRRLRDLTYFVAGLLDVDTVSAAVAERFAYLLDE